MLVRGKATSTFAQLTSGAGSTSMLYLRNLAVDCLRCSAGPTIAASAFIGTEFHSDVIEGYEPILVNSDLFGS
jgi:hypothetical protein